MALTLIIVLMDDVTFVELLLFHDAKFQEFSVPGFKDMIIVNGEKIGDWWCHVDFVVVFTSFYGDSTYEFFDPCGSLVGAVVSLEVFSFIIEELEVAVVDHVVQLA